MNNTQGTGLLDLVLDAHGGFERWSKARTIRARLNMAGPTWTGLGQEKIFTDVDVAEPAAAAHPEKVAGLVMLDPVPLADVGHLPHVEDPAEVARLIDEFVERWRASH
jgi:hypothetical protein